MTPRRSCYPSPMQFQRHVVCTCKEVFPGPSYILTRTCVGVLDYTCVYIYTQESGTARQDAFKHKSVSFHGGMGRGSNDLAALVRTGGAWCFRRWWACVGGHLTTHSPHCEVAVNGPWVGEWMALGSTNGRTLRLRLAV